MKRVLGFLCAMLLVLTALGNAQAVPLAALFDGGTITIGDKIFADWEPLFLDFSAPEGPDFSLIEVTPLGDPPFNPGLLFETDQELTVTDFDFIRFDLGFSVAALSGIPLIKDNSIELLDGAVGGEGLVSVMEDVYDPAGNLLAVKEVFADSALQELVLFDEADFPPQAQIFVEKSISLFGFGDGDLASLTAFNQRFSQVSEPATLLLVGTGLLGLAWFRRKFKS